MEKILSQGIKGEKSANSLIIDKEDYYHRYWAFLEEHSFFELGEKNVMATNPYTESNVRSFFASSDQLVFETTRRCNAACVYCGYGDLYQKHTSGKNKDLSVETAKVLIDYFHKKHEQNLNRSHYKDLTFGFYGGEPLLNFKFIKETIHYIESKEWNHCNINYRITTNGLLLSNYIAYLVNRKFRIYISLDGNELHNKFRITKDGKPIYDKVMRNILDLKHNYPNYFEEFVRFNAVIHSENSPEDVMDFYKKNFGKEPLLLELSNIGTNPQKESELKKMYWNHKSMDTKETSRAVVNQRIKMSVLKFLRANSNYFIDKYDQLLDDDYKDGTTGQTGTCQPFKMKIYCTVEGDLFPCERIPRHSPLGKVDDEKVYIDYQKVAQKYNQWYKELSELCNKCYDSSYCSVCIYMLNLNEPHPTCSKFMPLDSYRNFLKNTIDSLEKHPGLYLRLKDTVLSKVKKKNDSIVLWLYLHPYVYLNIKKSQAIVYNSLNGKILEYNNDENVLKIFKKLGIKRNLYVVGLKRTELTAEVLMMIKEIRSHFTGDVVDAKSSSRKPFQFKPIFQLEQKNATVASDFKIKLLQRDEITDYLKTLNLYISSTCKQKCSVCKTAYKQFTCCRAGEGSELPMESIEKILQETENTTLKKINILGGDITRYSQLKKLVERLNKLQQGIAYYIHYLNLWESDSQKWLKYIAAGIRNSLHIVCDFPLKSKSLTGLQKELEKYDLQCFFHYIVEKEEDIEMIPGINDSEEQGNIIPTPFFNGKNLEFFKEYVFTNRTELEFAKPSINEIHARTLLNTTEFGQLNILNNGKIYANLNRTSIGKIGNTSLIEAIKNEMTTGKSWNMKRKHVSPCKKYPYNCICPPISGYEFALGRYNTCTILKEQGEPEDHLSVENNLNGFE